MDPKYLPTTRHGKLARVTEECGEVLQLVGKINRFGVDSYHPADPARVTNRNLILAEIDDLLHALDELRQDLYT